MKSFIILTLVLWATVNCASLNLGRILGGREAELGEAPYILLIYTRTPRCAGVLIKNNWALTAGHCLDGLDHFNLYGGLHEANGMALPETQKRQIPSRDHYVIHENYSKALDSVDLGLIYIAQPFDINQSVKTIALATENYEQSTSGKTYGWGEKERGIYPTSLRVADVNIISYEQCREKYTSEKELVNYNICTEGAVGPCFLDSGGPLIHDTPEGIELVGIVSSTEKPCDNRTRPTFYMNVAMFHEWINSTITDFVVPS